MEKLQGEHKNIPTTLLWGERHLRFHCPLAVGGMHKFWWWEKKYFELMYVTSPYLSTFSYKFWYDNLKSSKVFVLYSKYTSHKIIM